MRTATLQTTQQHLWWCHTCGQAGQAAVTFNLLATAAGIAAAHSRRSPRCPDRYVDFVPAPPPKEEVAA